MSTASRLRLKYGNTSPLIGTSIVLARDEKEPVAASVPFKFGNVHVVVGGSRYGRKRLSVMRSLKKSAPVLPSRITVFANCLPRSAYIPTASSNRPLRI